ncbi:MAG: outer membrane lipoprotein carrier protein LolA [Pseudomonadota bacterium]
MSRMGRIACLLMIVASFFTLGWADSFEGIQAAAGKIHSLEADFVQEKHMRILAVPLIARGHLIFRSPDSLRWEYRHPMQSVLLMHGGISRRFIRSDQGWREDAGAELNSMNFVFQEISNWLKGRFDENPLFTATLMPGNKIVLTPKGNGMDQFIQRVEMVMADEPGLMKEVLVFESADSFTRFSFVNPQLNQPLAETVFEKAQ